MATENVYLFYANIVDYVRVVAVLWAYWCMHTVPWLAMALYALSVFLDEIDGYLARKYDQCSHLGHTLDMLTDQCGQIGIFIGLGEVYPDYNLLFKLLAVLNVAGPWYYQVAGLVVGDKTGYHSVGKAIVIFYFTNDFFFRFMCNGGGLFQVSLFLTAYYPDFLGGFWWKLALLTFPIGVGKSLISFIRVIEGARWLASLDFQDRKAKSAK